MALHILTQTYPNCPIRATQFWRTALEKLPSRNRKAINWLLGQIGQFKNLLFLYKYITCVKYIK